MLETLLYTVWLLLAILFFRRLPSAKSCLHISDPGAAQYNYRLPAPLLGAKSFAHMTKRLYFHASAKLALFSLLFFSSDCLVILWLQSISAWVEGWSGAQVVVLLQFWWGSQILVLIFLSINRCPPRQYPLTNTQRKSRGFSFQNSDCCI